MKYCLVHLGCQMNASDTERVATVLGAAGFERTDDETAADLLGVVACSVRQKAIDRVYTRIHRWNEWKRGRPLLTFLTGCVLDADSVKFQALFDFTFKVEDVAALPDLVRGHGVVLPGLAGETFPADGDAQDSFWRIAPSYTSPFTAHVPIQNGCDKFCAYCAVPYTRGREQSRPAAEILAEVEALVGRGYKSITLLGQNVNSYGRDRRGAEPTFARLLGDVASLVEASGRECLVYFTAPHPADMTLDVLETMAAHRALARQVHLPLQAGDDEVLRRMNRPYTYARYRELVAAIRELLPAATLFTDMIVGFPGETAAQFERSREALEELAFDMAFVALYSPRPGARSADLPDDVPHAEKKRRLHVLAGTLKRTSLANNRRLVGRVVRVLVDGPGRKPGLSSGRTEGLVSVQFPSADAAPAGTFVDVRITAAVPFAVAGELQGA